MGLSIVRGSSKFKRGFNSPGELQEYLKKETTPAVAFVGRSNVGKSSLINAIFGNKTARTSKTPGRTQEINLFSFEVSISENETKSFLLFDLPGYGHAEVSKEMLKKWTELMNSFFRYSPKNFLILNLQDARHPNQKADLGFKEYIKEFGLPCFLAFNKMDKLKTQKEKAALNKEKEKIFSEYKFVKQIFFVSAEKKTGTAELENSVLSFLVDQ